MGFITDLELKAGLENDEICECGTHSELFEACEDYDPDIDQAPAYYICPTCKAHH